MLKFLMLHRIKNMKPTDISFKLSSKRLKETGAVVCQISFPLELCCYVNGDEWD